MLLFGTGVRWSETTALATDGFDLDEDMPIVRVNKDGRWTRRLAATFELRKQGRLTDCALTIPFCPPYRSTQFVTFAH